METNPKNPFVHSIHITPLQVSAFFSFFSPKVFLKGQYHEIFRRYVYNQSDVVGISSVGKVRNFGTNSVLSLTARMWHCSVRYISKCLSNDDGDSNNNFHKTQSDNLGSATLLQNLTALYVVVGKLRLLSSVDTLLSLLVKEASYF